jgi:hypothetical protein
MVAEGQNPKIVVSYRRSDSAMAGRIFDRLVQHFGKSNLFIDIDNVPLRRFPQAYRRCAANQRSIDCHRRP